MSSVERDAHEVNDMIRRAHGEAEKVGDRDLLLLLFYGHFICTVRDQEGNACRRKTRVYFREKNYIVFVDNFCQSVRQRFSDRCDD